MPDRDKPRVTCRLGKSSASTRPPLDGASVYRSSLHSASSFLVRLRPEFDSGPNQFLQSQPYSPDPFDLCTAAKSTMAASITVPKRPFLTLPFLLPSWTDSLSMGAKRHQSSYRRTKQRLRVKPDASFGPPQHGRDQIIFNPPSSAPSVYHTPSKFLPVNDARRAMRTETTAGIDANELPSVYKTEPERKYHLTPEDVEEIRKLRLSDPMTWSRYSLAKKFECSPLFIAKVCEASPDKKQIQKQVLEAVQSRWGPKRRMAREDRQLRREAWGRDE